MKILPAQDVKNCDTMHWPLGENFSGRSTLVRVSKWKRVIGTVRLGQTSHAARSGERSMCKALIMNGLNRINRLARSTAGQTRSNRVKPVLYWQETLRIVISTHQDILIFNLQQEMDDSIVWR
jgi:hypothetical protein